MIPSMLHRFKPSKSAKTLGKYRHSHRQCGGEGAGCLVHAGRHPRRGGASRPPETRSISQSATKEGDPFRVQGSGKAPLLAQASASIKQELLTRFQSGAGNDYERRAVAQGLSGLAGADATLKATLLTRFQSGDVDWQERYALAEGLSGLAGADAALKDVLLSHFQSGKGEWLERRALAEGLSGLAEADAALKAVLLTRFQSGDGDGWERSALAQGLAPLALRDADVRSVLIAQLKADHGLHDMAITTATWRLLRVDRLAAPAQQPQL